MYFFQTKTYFVSSYRHYFKNQRYWAAFCFLLFLLSERITKTSQKLKSRTEIQADSWGLDGSDAKHKGISKQGQSTDNLIWRNIYIYIYWRSQPLH